MIEGKRYLEVVSEYFEFLVTEMDFHVSHEELRSNVFFEVEFRDLTRAISISYENIEDYLVVIVCMLQKGEMPQYDDKTRTIHLNRLTTKILPRLDKEELDLNAAHFINFVANGKLERKLLKSAKELRLCLMKLAV